MCQYFLVDFFILKIFFSGPLKQAFNWFSPTADSYFDPICDQDIKYYSECRTEILNSTDICRTNHDDCFRLYLISSYTDESVPLTVIKEWANIISLPRILQVFI